MVTYDEFAKLDIRVGKILNVEDHEQARKPMYKLTIDFGAEIGQRQIIAGIKASYSRDELMDKKVVCIDVLAVFQAQVFSEFPRSYRFVSRDLVLSQ